MHQPLEADRQNDRPLPHSLEAERGVLGACLLNAEAFDQAAAVVGDRDFFRDAHRRIWKTFEQLHDRGVALDLVTVANELGDHLEAVGGRAYIAGLVDGVPRSTNVEYYAGIVREKAHRRRTLDVLNNVAEQISEGGPVAWDALDEVRGEVLPDALPFKRVMACDADDTPLDFLWTGRIERNTHGLISGLGDAGKGHTGIAVVAALSTGHALPGMATPHDPMRCAWIRGPGEDTLAVLRGRLEAARADLQNVELFDVDATAGALPLAIAAAREAGAEFIVYDSVIIFAAADGVETAKPEPVRRWMVEQAKAAGCDAGAATLTGVIHWNKNTEAQSEADRVANSRQFVDSARFVLAVKDRQLTVAKLNNGEKAPPLPFEVIGTENGHAAVAWGTPGTTGPGAGGSGGGGRQLTDQALDWIREWRDGNPTGSFNALKKAFRAAGHKGRDARLKEALAALDNAAPTVSGTHRDTPGHTPRTYPGGCVPCDDPPVGGESPDTPTAGGPDTPTPFDPSQAFDSPLPAGPYDGTPTPSPDGRWLTYPTGVMVDARDTRTSQEREADEALAAEARACADATLDDVLDWYRRHGMPDLPRDALEQLNPAETLAWLLEAHEGAS